MLSIGSKPKSEVDDVMMKIACPEGLCGGIEGRSSMSVLAISLGGLLEPTRDGIVGKLPGDGVPISGLRKPDCEALGVNSSNTGAEEDRIISW